MTELALQVLLALADAPAHGYAIGKDIEARSGGRLDPTTGALYQALKRLSEAKLIEAADPPAGDTGDARRRYFAITRAGRTAAAEELERLDRIVKTGRHRRLHRAGSR
jgi:DNA-binding PadR family transcriptional regulator